jgi:hypothetical protein
MKDKFSVLIRLLLLVAMLLLTSCGGGGGGGGGTPDDNYEPNDVMASAYDLSSDEQTWLSTIDGLGVQSDDDWYQIDVTPGFERVIVELQFTHADGDIDLTLLNASGTPLAVSNGVTDDEYIDYTVPASGTYYIGEYIDYTVPASGTYYIGVYFSNAGNTYDLWWDDISVSDDNYEPNNIMSQAYDLSSDEQTWLSTIDGLGVQYDDDWYQIDVTPGFERVNVDLQFTHANGDIDLALLNASGTPLAVSESTTDDEHIDYTVPASGTYYIGVYFGNAGNTYDLWWDDLPP